MDGASEMNRRRVDILADRHARAKNPYYDVEGFLAGESSLNERERSEVAKAVPSVDGLDLLHLQCHIGLDTLSWARLGARVVGVDYSTVSIARAREFATRSDLPARFIDADVRDLPSELDGRFNIVFASYGFLPWIQSAADWMQTAARCLRPGGHLVMVEIHPLVCMLASIAPLAFSTPYSGEQPMHYHSGSSFAAQDLPPDARDAVQYSHGLGEVVSAAAGAGLVVESLTEWFDEGRDQKLIRSDDGRMRFPLGGQYLPTSYGLRARRV